MKSFKSLICLLILTLGMIACGSDEENKPVVPSRTGGGVPYTPQPDDQPSTPEELLETYFLQWVSTSDATLCWEITEKAFNELKKKKIEASFGVAWSTIKDDLLPVDNKLYAETRSVDFSQGAKTLTKLMAFRSSTVYYYVPYVNMNGELHLASVRSFTTMDEDTSPGHTPAGVQAVDMGLPSGTKWANMNIGADKEEDAGLYFAWGETEGYVADGSDDHFFNWVSYKWCNDSRTSQSKYCTNISYGLIDNRVVLEFADDAAFINWGKNWRMPTEAEIGELIENTQFNWTIQEGVVGFKLTSTTTGNSLFLPAAGCRVSDSLYEKGTDCYYWSSSLDANSPYSSNYLRSFFMYNESEYELVLASLFRYYGMNIRPVLR